MGLIRYRTRSDYKGAAVDAIGNVGLGAVNDPVVAIARGAGFDACKVTACSGFGHRDTKNGLAADALGKQPRFQRLAAKVSNVGSNQAAVQGQEQ